MNQYHFKDFKYKVEELSAYAFCIDTFIISLKTGEVIQYKTENSAMFLQWLETNGIRDVNSN